MPETNQGRTFSAGAIVAIVAVVGFGVIAFLAIAFLMFLGRTSSTSYSVSAAGAARAAPNLTGRVLLRDGAPVELARIRITWTGAAGNGVAERSTNEGGRFDYEAVDGRTYEIDVLAIGRDLRPVDFEPIEVTAPSHGIDLVVEPPAPSEDGR